MLVAVDKRECKKFRSDFAEFKLWWNIWPTFLVQEVYSYSSEGLRSIVSYTNMTAVSQISENNDKSFNMRRICVQKNFLQILMVAYKPLEWP